MTSHCGYIALVGRPNVGKSTLLNQLVQQKISITSRKPQTTRHSILGICTDDMYQYIYVDTPGINQNIKKTINKMMNKTAIHVLRDVDIIAFVVDGIHWTDEDGHVLELVRAAKIPCILVINKVDKMADKSALLPYLEAMGQRYSFKAMVPLSAKTGAQLASLQKVLHDLLPAAPFLFAKDQVTDRSVRFLCAELLREKVFRLCGQELPYAVTVGIEKYQDEGTLVRIFGLILVDKESQKRMIIGDSGSKLKAIATDARIDMERMLGKKVFLQCYCKVKSGWADDERLLKQFGYD